MYEPEEGYFVGFSGGKDSTVVYYLVKKANVKAEFYYSFTFLDYPETVMFIKKNFKDVIFLFPKNNFWDLIERYGPPTRWKRWCCTEFKKSHGRKRVKVLGVRREESVSRSKSLVYEYSKKDNAYHLHPIVDWTEDDVWTYIKMNNLKYNPLYDLGYKRVSCRFCPFKRSSERIMDSERYPEFKALLIKHFDVFVERTKQKKEK